MTKAVAVHTKIVSINTAIIAESPCCTGCSTSATAWEFGVEPIPASFEKSPLATPYLTACFTPMPAAPQVLLVD